MALLATLEMNASVDFVLLKNLLDVTDGNLGAHLQKLEQAGFLQIEKTFVKRKPKTYIRLTKQGRKAFNDHITTLEQIIHGGRHEE